MTRSMLALTEITVKVEQLAAPQYVCQYKPFIFLDREIAAFV